MQTGLRHHSQQTQRFERDSFPARVRSGDDQSKGLSSKIEINWNHFLWIKQWMAGAEKPYDAAWMVGFFIVLERLQ